MDGPEHATYEITGPDERGYVRLKMPNLDPGKRGEFFCITLGTDKNAIAEAMRRWLSITDEGKCH